ncbi:MAG: Uma2 family endonuclease [Coleofasciculaceae cyanobacterium RL_1_1]|nr:Uma2 family endonuclease [Coleofasciculaceae cyanobacterium RL_1_1]
MLASDPLYITPDDYLAAEEISPMRHEYRDGEVFAMTGGTLNHNTIISNLITRLKNHLRGSGCFVFAENVKTRIAERNAFYYPDLAVTCDDRDRPSNALYIEHPSLIIEVLSPSTARFDRTEKFADYRTIPSLMEYVLVFTDHQVIEVFQRNDRGVWEQATFEDHVQLISVNMAIAIAEIYADTDIPR